MLGPRACSAVLAALLLLPARGAAAEVLSDFPCPGCVMAVPDAADAAARAPAPLLVALHGDGGNVRALVRAWQGATASAGVLLLALRCPRELGCSTGSWWQWLETSGHDPAWLGAQIDAAAARFPVDPRRVYATGYSGGATYLGWYAPRHADRFAAVAHVAGGAAYRPACPACKVPVLFVLGSTDPMIEPYTRPLRDWYEACGGHEIAWETLRGVTHESILSTLQAGKAREILGWLLARPASCVDAGAAAPADAGGGDAGSGEVRGEVPAAAEGGPPQRRESPAAPPRVAPSAAGCSCRAGGETPRGGVMAGVVGAALAWSRSRGHRRRPRHPRRHGHEQRGAARCGPRRGGHVQVERVHRLLPAPRLSDRMSRAIRMRRVTLLLLAVTAGCAPEPAPHAPAQLAPRPPPQAAINSPAPPAAHAPQPSALPLPVPHDAPPADLRTPSALPSVCPRPATPTSADNVLAGRFTDVALVVGGRIELADEARLVIGGRRCVHFENVEIIGGDGLFVGGGARARLHNVVIRGKRLALSVGGDAHVAVEGGSLVARHAIDVTGRGVVSLAHVNAAGRPALSAGGGVQLTVREGAFTCEDPSTLCVSIGGDATVRLADLTVRSGGRAVSIAGSASVAIEGGSYLGQGEGLLFSGTIGVLGGGLLFVSNATVTGRERSLERLGKGRVYIDGGRFEPPLSRITNPAPKPPDGD